jgi:beta propeller repeat protein
LLHRHQETQAFEPPDPRWVAFQVTTGTLKSGSVSVYQDTIMWSQHLDCDYFGPYPSPEYNSIQITDSPPEEPWDICAYDSHNKTITTVHSGGHLGLPEQYDNWLVMTRGAFVSNIVAKNLDTLETFSVWGSYTETLVAHIYKDIIVGSPNNKTLMTYNLGSQQHQTIADIPDYPDGWILTGHAYENIIVWRQTSSEPFDFNIMGYDLIAQKTFTISANPGNESGANIDQDIVVWSWNGDIYGYDLQSDQRLTITQDAATQNSPKISGNLVIWKDDRNAAWDIYAYNLKTGEEYRVTQQPDNIRGIDIWGNLIVWERAEVGLFGSTADEIRAARLMSHFHFLPFIQQTASTP